MFVTVRATALVRTAKPMTRAAAGQRPHGAAKPVSSATAAIKPRSRCACAGDCPRCAPTGTTGSGQSAPESYLIKVGGRDLQHIPITMADGMELPRSSGFHVTIPRAVGRALLAAPAGTVPLTVRDGTDPSAPRQGSTAGPGTV